MSFIFETPINPLSIAQVGLSLAVEFFKKGLNPLIYPIGNVDFSAFDKAPPEFYDWVKNSIKRGETEFDNKLSCLKNWHIIDSRAHLSRSKQVHLAWHELDNATPTEINICNNNDVTIFTSQYTVDVFKKFGCTNAIKIPLGFDYTHFHQLKKKYTDDNVITWGLAGKVEPIRKNQLEVLSAWAERFGNSREHFLNCAIFNPFIPPEQQSQLISQTLGKKYYNINFNPFMATNSAYNDYLSSLGIYIGLSRGESWELPCFQSLCMGKHIIGLNGHAFKEYLTESNSVLIEPYGKVPAWDGIFFKEGGLYNQGNFLDWKREDLMTAFNRVLERYKKNKINEEGFKVKEKFTYEKTADKILELLLNN